MIISFSKSATKKLLKYNQSTRDRIYKAIKALPHGDVKRLRGNDVPPLYRLRIGTIRVIFIKDLIRQEILIIEIDSRGEIYK